MNMADLILTDDLQIHLLELSKLRVTAQNVYNASPAERWAYFLRNAEQMTKSDISRLFPDEEIAEAAGVLEMISQTPEQRLLYNARLKFQRDEETRLLEARQEGAIVGRIHLLQELLGLRQWTMDEFAGCDATQLAELEDQLKQQLRSHSQ